MMNVPWWGWVLAILAIVLFHITRTVKAGRSMVRAELIEYLAEQAPELAVEVRGGTELAIRKDGSEDEGSLFLDNLFLEVSRLGGEDIEGRRILYDNLLNSYREHDAALELDPDRDLVRLRPRILRDRDLESFRKQTDSKQELPSVSFGIAGLRAVVVVDSENSVRYVDEEGLTSLGLGFDEALERAKENLSDTFLEEVVGKAVSGSEMIVVKSVDDSNHAYEVTPSFRIYLKAFQGRIDSLEVASVKHGGHRC